MAGDELADVLSEFARTMLTDFPIQRILDHLNGAALRYERLQTELGEGPCLAACHTGEAVAVPDLHDESRFPRFSPRALEAGLAAVFTFPLCHGDARVGALDLYRDTVGALSDDAMTTAQTLADVAAAYVLNAEARAELQDASDRASHAARHDPLTGLPNRALMLERLGRAFARSGRSRSACALLFVDLNGHSSDATSARGSTSWRPVRPPSSTASSEAPPARSSSARVIGSLRSTYTKSGKARAAGQRRQRTWWARRPDSHRSVPLIGRTR